MRVVMFALLVTSLGWVARPEILILPPLDQREILSQHDLQEFLAEGERGLREGLYAGGVRITGRCSKRLDTAGGLKSGPILRYGNPEVVDLILSIYIAEYQRALRVDILTYEQTSKSNIRPELLEIWNENYSRNCTLLERSVAKDGKLYREEDVSEFSRKGEGENEVEYLQDLASLAESTLSPRIYDYVWDFPYPGTWRLLYLASVLSGRTVEHLGSATLAERLGSPRPLATGFLFRADTGAALEISEAMQVLSLMTDAAPKVVSARRSYIKEFVRKYSLFYWTNRGRVDYSETLDYRCRLHALEIIAAAGSAEDIQFVKAIAADAPSAETARIQKRVPPAGERPEIADKAAQVLDELRLRNTSVFSPPAAD